MRTRAPSRRRQDRPASPSPFHDRQMGCCTRLPGARITKPPWAPPLFPLTAQPRPGHSRGGAPAPRTAAAAGLKDPGQTKLNLANKALKLLLPKRVVKDKGFKIFLGSLTPPRVTKSRRRHSYHSCCFAAAEQMAERRGCYFLQRDS